MQSLHWKTVESIQSTSARGNISREKGRHRPATPPSEKATVDKNIKING